MALTILNPASEEPIAVLDGHCRAAAAASRLGDDREAAQRRLVHISAGRLAQPRAIVTATLFVAGDESSDVSGATCLVDGGVTAAYVTPE
jgi:NAD(P)-dependent dehydrogenase (short-subunit alcohol dehydrogenase family)